jgi:hypothetical protein
METGQKVYINARDHFYPGEVVKITPSGLVDVKFGDSGLSRFKKDGRRQGDSYYHGWRLDTEMSFDDRSEWLKDVQARSAVTIAIKSIEYPRLETWGRTPEKQEMAEALDKVQAQVDAARELLNKCK